MRNLRIFIAEPDQDLRLGLQMLLDPEPGMRVIGISVRPAGLVKQLKAVQPDILLLDVEMPRMDGFELLRTLREQPEYAETPIVMITSRSGKKHREKAMHLGATDYAIKPIHGEALRELIRRHVV